MKKKKKILSWGNNLVSLRAEDSRIPRMPVINPLQALVHPQTQKKYSAWIVNPQPQLIRIRLFWYIDLQIRNCGFQSSNQLMSQLQKSKFAVLVLGFEKLGWELDNCGRTIKTPIVASIVYMVSSPKFAFRKNEDFHI
jgi:hypothetical protein